MKEKIALGFGNNIDYEILLDSELIEGLVRQYDICAHELDVNKIITCERDLIISILGFLQVGSGGERFVASSDIVEQFSQKCERKITLGGTSVRAAIAMRKLGYTSALHLVTMNEQVRKLIPHDSPYVCSNRQDSSYPHLIVQFGKDTRVKASDINIRSHQANRLIYHSDTDNITMNLSSDFAELITDAQILLVSGFNAMHDQALLADRLESVLSMMERLPENATVFCEDAGYFEPKFSYYLYRVLSKRMTIFSLNEDELQGYLNTNLNLMDVFQVKEALAELQRVFPVPTLVLHTKNWALAYGQEARAFSSALKAAVTMATTRYCYGDDFTIQDYSRVGAFSPLKESVDFADNMNKMSQNQICCVPVAYITPRIATTVGLGDAFVGGFLPALLSN